MANKFLFWSMKKKGDVVNAMNDAGGLAYRMPAKHALAQLAATGCFNGTFYVDAEGQLALLRSLVDEVNDNAYLAKLAVYGRQRAFMKDMPAALLVLLSKRDPALFHKAFDKVVDNGRVLRTMFQMIRSGQFGRKSLSHSLQRAFQRWLNSASVDKLMSASIGNDPSLRDVFRLARPTPKDNARRALFGWLTDKPIAKWAPATLNDLPDEVRDLIAFRNAERAEEQAAILNRLNARWDLLADSAKGPEAWAAMVPKMGLQAVRMNLNTLLRQGALDSRRFNSVVQNIANRLGDEAEIRRARQFPYQFLSAYLNADDAIPSMIKSALKTGAELACGNVPKLAGPVVIGLDVSGSMQSAVTGNRGRGATSKVRCVDVAALFAAAILRKNPDSVVIPFDTSAYDAKIDPDDSILSIAERLAKYGGGGTNCSLPIAKANRDYKNRKFVGCVLISDNESWVGAVRNGQTGVMSEWKTFVANQLRLAGADARSPKLVCIDIQPNVTTQAPDRPDILNVGGFSDAVFDVVAAFLAGDFARFVQEVESVEL